MVTRTVPYGTDSNESLLWTTDSGSSGKKALGSFTRVRNSEEKRIGGNSAYGSRGMSSVLKSNLSDSLRSNPR